MATKQLKKPVFNDVARKVQQPLPMPDPRRLDILHLLVRSNAPVDEISASVAEIVDKDMGKSPQLFIWALAGFLVDEGRFDLLENTKLRRTLGFDGAAGLTNGANWRVQTRILEEEHYLHSVPEKFLKQMVFDRTQDPAVDLDAKQQEIFWQVVAAVGKDVLQYHANATRDFFNGKAEEDEGREPARLHMETQQLLLDKFDSITRIAPPAAPPPPQPLGVVLKNKRLTYLSRHPNSKHLLKP